MHAKIPADIYPVRPSGFATYFAWPTGSDGHLPASGQVPVWMTFAASGYGRFKVQMLVRVRPEIEVVLESPSREKEAWQETDAALRKRLTLPSWPERNWWVARLIYVAQPAKRTPTEKSTRSRCVRATRQRSGCMPTGGVSSDFH